MSSFIEELKRRNVVRVGVAYVVIAWVVAQVAELALESFEAPVWVIKTVLLLLALGLPFALFFAWAFEITPEGIKKEKDVDRSKSITAQTGRKLDFVIIGVLSVAVAWFAWDKFAADRSPTRQADQFSSPSGSADGRGVDQPAGSGSSGTVLPATTEKSVAVLPFVAMSSGEDDGFFADGLTEEILNALAQLPELLVTARTSAFSFKDQDLPVQEIAEALNVNHVVEGSVRRAGDRLRVTAQLIRASDGFHLWSQTYDSNSGDVIAVQEDIARQIAASLDVYLDETRLQLMRNVGLRDAQAFIDFQKGFDLYNRAHGEMETVPTLVRANEYFQRVIDRVPDFDHVYILHSDLAVHFLYDNVAKPGTDQAHLTEMNEAYQSAVADYEAAIQYAETPERRASHEFNLAFVTGDWRGLRGRMQQALADQSCQINNWLPNAALPFGKAEAFSKRMKIILACDPRRSVVWFNAVRTAFWVGNREEALRLAKKGLDMAPGAWLSMMYIHLLIAEGRFDDAEREIENRLRRGFQAALYKALNAAQQGDQARYAEMLEEFRELHTEENEFWPLIVLAWGGRRDEANALAANIDKNRLGPFALAGIAMGCGCGAPWDIEVTPQFANKLKEAGLPWPPAAPMRYTLKDW